MEPQLQNNIIPCIYQASCQDQSIKTILTLTQAKDIIIGKQKPTYVDIEQPICLDFNPQYSQMMILLNSQTNVRIHIKHQSMIQQFFKKKQVGILHVPSKQKQQEISYPTNDRFVHCGTYNGIHNCVIKFTSDWKLYIDANGSLLEKGNDGLVQLSAKSYDWPNGDIFYFWKYAAAAKFNQLLTESRKNKNSKQITKQVINTVLNIQDDQAIQQVEPIQEDHLEQVQPIQYNSIQPVHSHVIQSLTPEKQMQIQKISPVKLLSKSQKRTTIRTKIPKQNIQQQLQHLRESYEKDIKEKKLPFKITKRQKTPHKTERKSIRKRLFKEYNQQQNINDVNQLQELESVVKPKRGRRRRGKPKKRTYKKKIIRKTRGSKRGRRKKSEQSSFKMQLQQAQIKIKQPVNIIKKEKIIQTRKRTYIRKQKLLKQLIQQIPQRKIEHQQKIEHKQTSKSHNKKSPVEKKLQHYTHPVKKYQLAQKIACIKCPNTPQRSSRRNKYMKKSFVDIARVQQQIEDSPSIQFVAVEKNKRNTSVSKRGRKSNRGRKPSIKKFKQQKNIVIKEFKNGVLALHTSEVEFYKLGKRQQILNLQRSIALVDDKNNKIFPTKISFNKKHFCVNSAIYPNIYEYTYQGALIKIYKAQQLIKDVAYVENNILAIADNSLLLTNNKQQTIQLVKCYDRESGFSNIVVNDHRVILSSKNGMVRFYCIDNLQVAKNRLNYDPDILGIQLSQNGDCILLTYDNRIVVTQINEDFFAKKIRIKNPNIMTLSHQNNKFYQARFNALGNSILSSYKNNIVEWNLLTGIARTKRIDHITSAVYVGNEIIYNDEKGWNKLQ